MGGPWEKYGSTGDTDSSDDSSSGPWSKYSSSSQTPDVGLSFDGIKDAALSGLSKASQFVDSYTGAPTRAAIGSLESSPTDVWAALSAAKNQFGADPSTAPTGKDLAAKLGLSTDSVLSPDMQKDLATMIKSTPLGYIANRVAPGTPEAIAGASPAGAVGAGIDLAANPLNYIPVEGIAKLITEPFSDALGSYAESKAVTATGATGAQKLKFADNAGRELLDQGVVKFGNSQATVAEKAADKLAEAGKSIDSILTNLDKRGATVDQRDIIASLRSRASTLGQDPSQYGVADSLARIADRMEGNISANGGNSKIPLTAAETTKKGFQSGANYNSSPHDLSLSGEAASIYRKAVENAATKFDPSAASAFKDEKSAYGLMKPIKEAAERRAATTSQSPHGGLLDVAATIAGEGAAGPVGAIAAPIARRVIAPRIASSIAAAADAASKAIGAIPDTAAAIAPAASAASMSSISPAGAAAGSNGLLQLPAAAQSHKSVNRSPAGPDAWAQQGLSRLGISDKNVSSKLMGDPVAKNLLIHASSFPAGSKALKQVMNQLQSRWGAIQ